MTTPIEVLVKRYRCPFCPRSLSSKARMVEHIGKCWRNPAARGCKTCRHFSPPDDHLGDECFAGVDLTAPCRACEGTYDVMFAGRVGVEQEPGWVELPTCQSCGGSRRDPDRATRLIIRCGLWEADPHADSAATLNGGAA